MHLILIMAMATGASAVVNEATLLSRVPMIMTHDAGSGYLGSGLVNRWTQTQSVGLAKQLACGARAFDARPMRKDNRTIWHHGDVAIDYAFSQSLADMASFLASHPTELAVLLVSDCTGGDDCMSHVATEAQAVGATVVSSCGQIAGLTLGKARAMGRLPKGGSMLVVTASGGSDAGACATTNYDPSMECVSSKLMHGRREGAARGDFSGGEKGILYKGCWRSDDDHDEKINKMLSALDTFIGSGLSNTSFWQAQALWQEGTETVAVGTLRDSSLLKDETESGLNAELAAQILAKRWKDMGLLEVNNVCDGGLALLAAINATYYR